VTYMCFALHRSCYVKIQNIQLFLLIFQSLARDFLELPIFLLNPARINSIPLSGGMFIQLDWRISQILPL